ncbi:MAG: hypothetical protein LBU96_07165 [Yokenella regensburgei]|jgi:hypothetical protein|nr:hypothetical protein [Yokenella regensburgei]
MDYYGLYPKYKMNRPLNDEEKKHQLYQSQPVELKSDDELVSDASVIKINSTYMEVVDKYYGQKGFVSIFTAFGTCLLSYMLVAMVFISTTREYFDWSDIWFLLVLSIPLTPVFLLCIILLKIEWFAWTHYPIRFNRKEQLVHVHRLNGTVFTVPWDKVFFTTGLSHAKGPTKAWYISGHVLADDGITVTETFCLPASHLIREELSRHWEFIRRYMEVGPEAVVDAVDLCMPVDGRREGYMFGLLRLLMNFSGSTIFLFPLTFPLCLVLSVSRYIAMLTSKIPVWPQEVEVLCQVTEDDPVNLSAATNSGHLWRDLFVDPPKHVY